MRSHKPIRVLVLIWLAAILAAYVVPFPAIAAPVTTADENGPNDEPNQKDLTLHTIDSAGLPNSLEVRWNWDETSWSGNNTGDGCALFDNNGNGLADKAVCVTVGGNPATQLPNSPRVFNCTDGKADRCTGESLISGTSTTCTVAITSDQPFAAGADTPKDTKASCHIVMTDVGGATAKLLNTCSFPSTVSHSDPSDCVLIPRDAFVKIIKVANPNDGTPFNFTINYGSGATALATINGSGSTAFIPVRSDVDPVIGETVPAGWALDTISCDGGSPVVTKPTVKLSLDPDLANAVTCTFTNTKNNPSLSIDKRANVSTYSAVGHVISYSYVVTNNGNVPLAGPVTISDDITTNETCPNVNTVGNLNGSLDPGESITCTSSHTVSQADLNAGSITNVATASAGGTTSPSDTVTVTASRLPALTIDKKADVATYSAVGQVISYSYVVTNTGNVRLAGPITVADDITANETCPNVNTVGNNDTYLDPGESITCTSSHTVTQGDLNAGSITNVATASAGGATSPSDTVTVTASRLPALTIDKKADVATYSAVGQVISYSYVVTNTGNVRLAGPVTVADDITINETCPNVNTVGNLDGFLDPGESITCTSSYTVTQADLNAGSVTNVATASAGGTTSPSDTVTVTASRLPALTIDKKADVSSYDAVGDVITYSYVVTNTGNVRLAGPVTVADDITINETCPNVNTVGNLDGFLDPGESITCTSSYTITQADLNAGSVTNVATASADGTTSPSDTVTVTASQLPALTIDKMADVQNYDAVGDIITYSYVVTNTGNVRLAGPVTVADDVTTNETCPNVNTVGNLDGFLDPGESITCTSSHTVTQADLDRGFIMNSATATMGTTTSPPDSVTVPAVQNSALTIDKMADVQNYDAVGDIITYSYVVTNTGNVRLAGPVTVADDVTTNETCPDVDTVGNLDAFLDPGESITCTSSHTVTQADLDRGFIMNSATATIGTTTSPPDSVTVPADQKPALTVDKSADVTSFDAVGDIITYSYVVTNTGNVRLAGPVSVSDDITADETCPALTTVGNLDSFLDRGESVTCTSSYTITQADLDRGSVTNVASASVPGGTTSPPDTVTVPADQKPALTVDKRADVTTFDAVGDVINYSYVVTNTGNVRLAGPVSVADDITADETCPDVNTVGNLDGFLDPGESVTCTSSYTIMQADLDRGSVTNVASASVPGGTTSPPDTVTVPATPLPGLTVDKTATEASYSAVGDVLHYKYAVTNTGNVRLAGPVTIDDDITTNEVCPNVNTVGNLDGFLDPNETIECSATYTITQADLDAGSVKNTATASAGGTKSPPDSVTVPADQKPDMTVAKGLTANADQDGSGSITEGDHITYTITINNPGNVTLTGVTVSDPIPAQTTFVSCAPAADCTTSGNPVSSVSWTVGPIAPGKSASVTLTVKVGMINTCVICNIASASSTETGGRQSPERCVTPVPSGHPELAHASGSALAAKIRVDLLGINQTVVPVSSSQSGIGHDGDDDSVLSLAVPPPAGAIAKLGLLTTTTSSTVSASPERAMDTGTAETLGVNLLNGTITADVVRGIAHAEANGVGSFISSAGSTFVKLKVSGVTKANVAPNTTIKLPAVLFGKGSFVTLYETIGSTSRPAAGQLSGGTYAADISVNMIHVFVTDSLPLVPGNQTAEIIVSGATAHADFPQTTLCPPGQAPRSVSGHAFIASAVVTTNDQANPEFLNVIEGFVGIPATGGADHQELASVTLPEDDGSVLATEAVATNSFGSITHPNGVGASSYAQAADVCLLQMPTGCTIRATLVRSQAGSFGPHSGTGPAVSNSTGTQLVGLVIGGTPINVTPAPNTVINIPGIGFVVLNEQFCDGAGTLPSCTTDGGRHSGITVRAIRIVVTALAPLGVGAEVIVAEAHSDVTRPPLTVSVPTTGI